MSKNLFFQWWCLHIVSLSLIQPWKGISERKRNFTYHFGGTTPLLSNLNESRCFPFCVWGEFKRKAGKIVSFRLIHPSLNYVFLRVGKAYYPRPVSRKSFNSPRITKPPTLTTNEPLTKHLSKNMIFLLG